MRTSTAIPTTTTSGITPTPATQIPPTATPNSTYPFILTTNTTPKTVSEVSKILPRNVKGATSTLRRVLAKRHQHKYGYDEDDDIMGGEDTASETLSSSLQNTESSLWSTSEISPTAVDEDDIEKLVKVVYISDIEGGFIMSSPSKFSPVEKCSDRLLDTPANRKSFVMREIDATPGEEKVARRGVSFARQVDTGVKSELIGISKNITRKTHVNVKERAFHESTPPSILHHETIPPSDSIHEVATRSQSVHNEIPPSDSLHEATPSQSLPKNSKPLSKHSVLASLNINCSEDKKNITPDKRKSKNGISLPSGFVSYISESKIGKKKSNESKKNLDNKPSSKISRKSINL